MAASNVGDRERTLRASVRRSVEDHTPVDPREAASRTRILHELEALDHPFDELAGPVHVTASALIVGRRGLVLHRHRRLGRWMQPGGHLEPGEEPSDAALRESLEETGIAGCHPPDGPHLVHLDVHPAASGHVHLDLRYLLLGGDLDPAPPPNESQDVKWCTWDTAMAMADDALVGAIGVAQSRWEAQRTDWLTAVRPSSAEDPDRVP